MPVLTPRERDLRRRLGIPDDARQVLVFGETSHWDPNWLLTSKEYFTLRVRHTLDRAIDALLREPQRVYSVECVFFLKMYWDRNPARHETIRQLVNSGRLRMTGSGITTPDTLLPDTEALIRDYLYGQEWLRGQGMTQEPHIAYLPDSFGHTPALPSILQALGIDGVAFARLDGGYFFGCDYRPARQFPLPGSSAYRLLKDERSLDVVWRDASGAEVLAHFCAFTYFQGDLLAYRGMERLLNLPLAIPDTSERHVAARIDAFAAQLAPLARTPYLFCPMGVDFVDPIYHMVPLLQRYNRVRYPETGIWAVNAGLDDYLDLLGEHRASLPVIELDPNPYFTGFYVSRPTLKQHCRRAADTLLDAERLALRLNPDGLGRSEPETGAGPAGEPQEAGHDLSKAWHWTMVSNHHDFITGTSPNRVVHREQTPRLLAAIATGERAIADVEARIERSSGGAAVAVRPWRADPPRWCAAGDRVRVETAYYQIEIDGACGGCITRMTGTGGAPILGELSADLVLYHDSGGLWRMGHEFAGGTFSEMASASAQPVKVDVRECGGAIEVTTRHELAGDTVTRTVWLRGDTPLVRLRITALLGSRRMLACRFRPGALAEQAAMDVPGGVVVRPAQKLFEPTYWSINRFVHVHRAGGDGGLAVFVPGPGTIAFDPRGVLDCVALRHATQERAFRILPVLAFPARGREREPSTCDLALWPTDRGDWAACGLPRRAHEAFDDPWNGETRARRRQLAGSLVRVDDESVSVLAVKPASRGAGVIVRLYAPRRGTADQGVRHVTVRWHDRPIARAVLCDARERDMEPLAVTAGAASVPIAAALASARLVLGTPAFGAVG